MRATSLTRCLVHGCLMLTLLLLVVLLFCSPARVDAVTALERQACPAQCEAADDAVASVRRAFAVMRPDLLDALDRPVVWWTDDIWPETRLRARVRAFVLQRVEALERLTVLALVRLSGLAAQLTLLLAFIAAVALDAAVARRVARENFEAARPAVSFLSALVFVSSISLGAALMTLPVAGAGTAGLVVLSLGAAGLHGWVRYFHVL